MVGGSERIRPIASILRLGQFVLAGADTFSELDPEIT